MTKFKTLPTMAEVNAQRRAQPKYAIQTRKAVKAKAQQAEGKQVKSIRAQCVERDGLCRVSVSGTVLGDVIGVMHHCSGPSAWCHLGEKTRAKTRNQAPEIRHTTAGSLMLCQGLHDQLDGRARPRLVIEALTDRGADGPLRFMMGAK